MEEKKSQGKTRFLFFDILLVILLTAGAVYPQICVDSQLPRPISGIIDGYPVYSYGEFDVYAVSPTYDNSIILQKNNSNPWKKIVPKKTWQITSNLLGLTPTRSPSSRAAELEPHSPLFFVDGNPSTVGFAGRPVGDPSITKAWLRIDLPKPMKITSVGLTGQPPANFEIRVFNWDLWQRQINGTAATEQKQWNTVYKVEGNKPQPLLTPDKTAPNVYKPEDKAGPSGGQTKIYRFEPVTTREVWLTAPDDFVLSSFEVYDESGQNVAMISKGCGVTVSKQQHLFWLSEQTQASLWQMQYDLGIKWLRLSYYLSPLIWTFVEKEKGVYTIDPYLDSLVTEVAKNGIEVTLTLGPPTHKLYDGEAATIEGFCNYTRFMVNHFKTRVKYFEILNEFYNQDGYGPNKQGPVETESSQYVRWALPAAKVIKEIDPQAKIVLCGPCPLVADFILSTLRKGMAKYADVVSWHPYSFSKNSDDDYAPEELDKPRHVWAPKDVNTYADAVAYLRRETAKLGFNGELWANETGAYAIHADRTSNLIAAKYFARSAVLHTSLNVPMFWNETTSLMRPAWQPFWGNHGADLKPAYSYYVMRTLCTLLDGAKAVEIAFDPTTEVLKLQKHSFSLPKNNKLLALWIAEKSRKHRYDNYDGIEIDLSVSIPPPVRIIGIDMINGREQDLIFQKKDNGTYILPKLIIRDYPVLLRVEY